MTKLLNTALFVVFALVSSAAAAKISTVTLSVPGIT